MSEGKVVQVIGAVIDVEFPRDKVPRIYDALKIGGEELTLEVQHQLGDGVVRTIALGAKHDAKPQVTGPYSAFFCRRGSSFPVNGNLR